MEPSSASGDERNDGSVSYEKSGRLEELLRQVFALAGEITKDQGLYQAMSADHTLGECTILRRAPVSASTGAREQHNRHGFLGQQNYEGIQEDKRDDSQSLSATSAVQEPFSPGTLTLSLDAMVEGDSSDSASCCLDTGSTASLAGRSPETTTQKNSLSSV